MSESIRMEQQLKGSDAKVEEGDVHVMAREGGGVQLAKSLPVQRAKGNSYLMGNLGKKLKKSHHFPMSVTELYSSLLNEGLIAPIVLKLVTNLPEGYDPSKNCKFHYDALGHSIEECYLLRYKIQRLIDGSAIIFEGAT